MPGYPFGGGNNSILIHTGQSALYIADGILEETLVHEASHTSLDAAHAAAPGWLAAQTADPDFISTYAEANPTTEDVAESYLTWIAVRHRASRISLQNYDLITQAIPNRLAYFDDMPCDLYPITSDVGIATAEAAPLSLSIYPTPANDWITVRTDQTLSANARFELFAADGRMVRSTNLNGQLRVDVSDATSGIYLWRCHVAGRTLGVGTIAIE
ncbi:MAG: T9SS type A sorting domain-containing protein [Flavobacteriales bacterium]|nr:T9SS type A sorting domain-containing protein [Flavobacteriales bacterium]